ncbi:MMPL family transporter [Nocardioides sp. URHA0020]|uniref:MMPL family transporter n=1 Tax=Nocardioides sp. URHA0020 TaxID=1380392 RepID=UPI000ACC3BA2|nr:MMPL family transporter [Nocardioides sp. URHA0020]
MSRDRVHPSSPPDATGPDGTRSPGDPGDPGSPDGTARPSRLVGLVTGRRTAWAVTLVAFVLAGLAIGVLGEGTHEQGPTDGLPRGADSTLATELRDRLPAESSSVAIVLYTADRGELSARQLSELEAQGSELGDGDGPALVPAEDGTAAIVVVPVRASDDAAVADAVTDLRERASAGAPDGVTAQVTGPAAVKADLSAVFDGADVRLLLATAGVVALLLLLTYRSPILWLIPLTVVAVADRLATVVATQIMGVLDVAWDASTTGILSVLVFGAGTDYALLLISRYRDELKSEESRNVAMAHALRRTAEAVLSSATTVFLALLTLLLSLIPTTRGLGLACAIGIVVAATFALLVLPAFLVLFGRWVFWPRVPHVGDVALVDGHGLWRRVGDRVAARPAAFITGALLLLALLAAGTTQIEVGLDDSDQFLDKPEAIAAADRLGESFPAGTTNPTQVLTRADPARVLRTVEDTPGVESAMPGARGGGIAEIDVILSGEPGSAEAQQAVDTLRDRLAAYDDTHVGGSEAESMDERSASQRDRLVILPLILLLVLGALGLLLRSVVAPLLLVGTVLATFAAALGASWWIFTQLLGFEAIDVSVPLFSFLFLVALGVDYNIFLVTRAREEALAHGHHEGMLRALTATGGVITSAGILLAAVFAVLGVLPLVVLAQIGTVICVGVLLDTLVVRTVLVPALALRLGDRFWWPRQVGVGARTRSVSPVHR